MEENYSQKNFIRDIESLVGMGKTDEEAPVERGGNTTKGLSEDEAIEREHTPVEYYVEPQLPSEHKY